MKESSYQFNLIKKIKCMFPDCIVIKNDSGYIQGIPDLTIFFENRWATLEVKASANSPGQPNQEYYVERMNDMSFSAFICPENEAEVLDHLQRSFASCR